MARKKRKSTLPKGARAKLKNINRRDISEAQGMEAIQQVMSQRGAPGGMSPPGMSPPGMAPPAGDAPELISSDRIYDGTGITPGPGVWDPIKEKRYPEYIPGSVEGITFEWWGMFDELFVVLDMMGFSGTTYIWPHLYFHWLMIVEIWVATDGNPPFPDLDLTDFDWFDPNADAQDMFSDFQDWWEGEHGSLNNYGIDNPWPDDGSGLVPPLNEDVDGQVLWESAEGGVRKVPTGKGLRLRKKQGRKRRKK